MKTDSLIKNGNGLHARHGMMNTKVYRVWQSMKTRCLNQNDPNYAKYGAKGITVCERWKKFTNFLNDMGHPKPGHQIDRIDNSKGYSPENCRWATPQENAQNKSSNHLLTYMGETKCLTQWARELGIPQPRVSRRIQAGWPVEIALSTKRLPTNPMTKKKIFQELGIRKDMQSELADVCVMAIGFLSVVAPNSPTLKILKSAVEKYDAQKGQS